MVVVCLGASHLRAGLFLPAGFRVAPCMKVADLDVVAGASESGDGGCFLSGGGGGGCGLYCIGDPIGRACFGCGWYSRCV